jgi:hypothetical protein
MARASSSFFHTHLTVEGIMRVINPRGECSFDTLDGDFPYIRAFLGHAVNTHLAVSKLLELGSPH